MYKGSLPTLKQVGRELCIFISHSPGNSCDNRTVDAHCPLGAEFLTAEAAYAFSSVYGDVPAFHVYGSGGAYSRTDAADHTFPFSHLRS